MGWWGPGWWGTPYPYYAAPPALVEPAPTEYIQAPAPPAQGYWYHCQSAEMYSEFVAQFQRALPARQHRLVPACPLETLSTAVCTHVGISPAVLAGGGRALAAMRARAGIAYLGESASAIWDGPWPPSAASTPP